MSEEILQGRHLILGSEIIVRVQKFLFLKNSDLRMLSFVLISPHGIFSLHQRGVIAVWISPGKFCLCVQEEIDFVISYLIHHTEMYRSEISIQRFQMINGSLGSHLFQDKLFQSGLISEKSPHLSQIQVISFALNSCLFFDFFYFFAICQFLLLLFSFLNLFHLIFISLFHLGFISLFHLIL